MNQSLHNTEDEIDWETIFERMTGSKESAVRRYEICRYLANTRDITSNDAPSLVSKARDSGFLVEIIVERFPDVYHLYYLVPPTPIEYPERVFVPFWSYVCTGFMIDRGYFSVSELCDRIAERAEGDIPDWLLTAIDENLRTIAPITSGLQSMRGRTVPPDTAKVYETLVESHGPSEGFPDRYF